MYARPMRIIISTLLLFFICSLSAETVYKTVDENGKIIFTDKPSEEAEQIKIKELDNSINNPNPGKYKPSTQKQEEEDKYKSLVVSSPENGAGIRSNNGNVSISVSLEPGLNPGHKIVVSMDGKEVGSGSSVSLQNVDRGTHSISARVVDSDGKTHISTSSTFSLLRASQ